MFFSMLWVVMSIHIQYQSLRIAVPFILVHSLVLTDAAPAEPTSSMFICAAGAKSHADYEKDRKSQSGEDQLLHEHFLPNRCNGSYLELGVLDSRRLGWSGLLIETSPHHFVALTRNRYKDKLVNAAICLNTTTIHYLEAQRRGGGAVGGVWEFMPEAFRRKWHPRINDSNIAAHANEVSCRPLSDILRQQSFTFFDFFSLDVEGAELEVLRSIDFDEVSFGMIVSEADEHDPIKNAAVRALLATHGYSNAIKGFRRSDYFVHPKFANIYKDHRVSLLPGSLNLSGHHHNVSW